MPTVHLGAVVTTAIRWCLQELLAVALDVLEWTLEGLYDGLVDVNRHYYVLEPFILGSFVTFRWGSMSRAIVAVAWFYLIIGVQR